MSTPWLVSYILLWCITALLVASNIGLMVVIAQLRSRRLSATGVEPSRYITPEEDGPPIGSKILAMSAESVNGYGLVGTGSGSSNKRTMLVFMKPLCGGCQHTAPYLADVAREFRESLNIIVIMDGDAHSTNAFLNVYPMPVPVVSDPERVWANAFQTQTNPGALLYSEGGELIRKGTIEYGRETILALLGDPEVPDNAWMTIYPGRRAAGESLVRTPDGEVQRR